MPATLLAAGVLSLISDIVWNNVFLIIYYLRMFLLFRVFEKNPAFQRNNWRIV